MIIPTIDQNYGFEDSGETHALVLELVEWPTLDDESQDVRDVRGIDLVQREPKVTLGLQL
jgi:hypothetical protein